MHIDETIKTYLDALAAKTSAPGGGSAAALAGAMGCALISMTLQFTIGKAAHADFEKSAQELLAKSEALRGRFVKFFDEDISGYENVMSAHRLPATGEADKIKRSRAIQEAFREATLVPLHICQSALEALKLCPELAEKANANLICDTQAAVYQLEAAFNCAKTNISMNQKSIVDQEFNKDIVSQMNALEKELNRCVEATGKNIQKVTGLKS
ncbi:MAG: cyclodeaminase/cyclohydrolase family protein [Candidatus Omnitrophota bacterium]